MLMCVIVNNTRQVCHKHSLVTIKIRYTYIVDVLQIMFSDTQALEPREHQKHVIADR